MRQKPTLLRGRVIGDDGRIIASKTMRLDEVKPQTDQQRTLTAEQRARAALVVARLPRHLAPTGPSFVSNLEKDLDPDREIRLWEAMLDTYDEIGFRSIPPERAFKAMILLTIGGVDVSGVCHVPEQYVEEAERLLTKHMETHP